MNFENRPTQSLRPYSGNARTHSPKQIKQIARSIERFGFNNPVLVDDDDQIIAGHGRVTFFEARSINFAIVVYCSKSLQLTNLTSPDLFEVVSARIVVPRLKFH